MSFIDEAKIDTDEDGFHLILYLDTGERYEFPIGNPEAFEYEVARTIGDWLSEGNIAKASARARRYFAERAAEPVE